MNLDGLSAEIHRYLQQSRDGLLGALDGLSDYDARRPMTPTGTNLLGLVKHVAGVELGYLVESVGRTHDLTLPWYDDGSVWENADMWATAEESREELVDLYRRVWRHADQSLEELPLDAPASVAWWPEERRQTTFGSLLMRHTAEVARHAGQADILREYIDGRAASDRDEMGDEGYWQTYVARIQAAADAHRA